MSNSESRDEPSGRRDERDTPSPDTGRDGENDTREPEPINLYIRGVAPQVKDEELERAFANFGTVVSCSVVRDPYTSHCRGFAFVKMATMEAAEAAMNVEQGINLCGRQLNVERARRKGPHAKTPGQYLGVDRSIRERFTGNKRRFDDHGGYEHGRFDLNRRDAYPRRPLGDDEDRYAARRRYSPQRRIPSPGRGCDNNGYGRDHFAPRGGFNGGRNFETGRRPGHPARQDGPPSMHNVHANKITASGRDNFGRDRR
jgi:RNA recognition motif-containing protein